MAKKLNLLPIIAEDDEGKGNGPVHYLSETPATEVLECQRFR